MDFENYKVEENFVIKKFIEIISKKGYIQLRVDLFRFKTIINDLLEKLNTENQNLFMLTKDKEVILNPIEIENHKNELIKDDNILKLSAYLDLREYFYSNGIGYSKYNEIRESIFNILIKKFPNLERIDDFIYDSSVVKIKEIKNLTNYLDSIKSEEVSKSNIYFRGQQDVNWLSVPSIFRNKNWIEHERNFIEEMLIHNPDDFKNCETTIEQLTKMQHYQVPTRLLDLSKNPLIALYFACENAKEKNTKFGEVILYQGNSETEKYFDSNSVSILSNISKLEDFDEKKLKDLVSLEKSYIDFKGDHDVLHKCMFVQVKQDNKRIQNQQGLFLLFGMGKTRNDPADSEQYYYKKDGKKLVFIVKNKKAILEELQQLNINKGFIYPEIDDYATYLKTEVFAG